ncbi:MAG: histidine kinase [Bacteroidota bacterium]
MEQSLPPTGSGTSRKNRRLLIIVLVALYLVMGFFYHLTIQLTSGFDSDFWRQDIVDYVLKALLTIPVWWIVFRLLRQRPLWQQLTAHLFLAPAWVFGWQYLYYRTTEWLGLWHLQGSGTWWDVYIPALFYMLQFGIFHLYEYHYRLQAQQRRASELREVALRSELTALKAQLNPHFLYNTFNTISASVPREMESTRELIATLADLFRYQLRASKAERVPLEDEINFVRQYLELEKARFGERLRIDIDLQPGTTQILIPPMLIQPLVENAVKHGISPKIEGGTVRIATRIVGKQLLILVSDTGVGMGTTINGSGVGLHNTRQRLLHQFNSELHLSENSPSGVQAQFSIPLDRSVA